MNKFLIAVATVFTGVSAVSAQGGSPMGGSLTSMVPMMVAMFAIIYFLMIRPEQKKAKEKLAMLNAIAKGDKVLTIGGIYGTVHAVKKNTITLRIDDNTNIMVAKTAISDKVLGDPDAEAPVAPAPEKKKK